TGIAEDMPTVDENSVTPLAWVSPSVNDYFQGTFEIFNVGPGTITAQVVDTSDNSTPIIVTAGNSIAVSVNNPAYLEMINLPSGTRGKFCMNLFKAMFA